jgi:hypothetical protein
MAALDPNFRSEVTVMHPTTEKYSFYFSLLFKDKNLTPNVTKEYASRQTMGTMSNILASGIPRKAGESGDPSEFHFPGCAFPVITAVQFSNYFFITRQTTHVQCAHEF